MSETMTGPEVITALLRGDFDDVLPDFSDAIQARREMNAQKNLVSLRLGDPVVLSNLRERNLNGQTGVISGLPKNGRSKRFDVTLDKEAMIKHRYTKDVPGVPSQCITKVAV
jgi:hypothetical protein